jgi:hypothetical protein
MAPRADSNVIQPACNGVDSMLQLLFFTFSVSMILLSVAVVIETAKQEMPYIRRALRLSESKSPQRSVSAHRRVRVTRQVQFRTAPAQLRLRAAA